VTLQVLAELKAIFKADAGLELNVSKTSILPKGNLANTRPQMVGTGINLANTRPSWNLTDTRPTDGV
jgi:hypothetical protein